LMTLIIRCELYPPTQRWPWLPPLFDQWFYRSCAREPSQRFATAGEQVAQLAVAFGVGIPGSQRAAPTMTDPMGATAAAPPTVPQPASYQPYAPPVQLVGGSTTAAGAMSRQPETNPYATEPSGFSAGKAV